MTGLFLGQSVLHSNQLHDARILKRYVTPESRSAGQPWLCSSAVGLHRKRVDNPTRALLLIPVVYAVCACYAQADAVFGKNRWDGAEWQTTEAKSKFQRMMVGHRGCHNSACLQQAFVAGTADRWATRRMPRSDL